MYRPKASYLKILTLLIFSASTNSLISQVVISDTNLYIQLLRGPDVQHNLDYALQNAASDGNSTGIDWLLRHGANIDTRTPENVTPIMFAVAAGETEAVKALLAYDPDLDLISAYGESPLIVAVKQGNITIAELLLRDSANVNLQDKHGFTALHLAAIYGNFYMTDLLIYYEADVNIRSRDGTTPLMVSVYGAYASITDLLLQNGAHVLEKDKEGFTPLMIAAQNGDTLISEMLLGRGADLFATNKYGYDALDMAIRLDHREAVSFLLKKQKNTDQSDYDHIDPYIVASTYRNNDIIEILRSNKIPEKPLKGFDQVSFTGSAKFCFHDIYTGFSITVREPKNLTGVFAGFDLKPGWSRVLVKETDELFYQYMDKSYLFYAGVLKEFPLKSYSVKGDWYFNCSLAAGYNFGNEFKGTGIRPESKLRLIPSIGFRYAGDSFGFQCSLEYTNTDFYRLGPVWLRTGFSFNLDFNNYRGDVKIIKW
jgi:ankyrin repeat protein